MTLHGSWLKNVVEPIVAALVSQRYMVLIKTIVGDAGIRSALRRACRNDIIRHDRCRPAAVLRIAGGEPIVERHGPLCDACLCGRSHLPRMAQRSLRAVISVV